MPSRLKKTLGISAKKFSLRQRKEEEEPTTLGVDVIDRRSRAEDEGSEEGLEDEPASSKSGEEVANSASSEWPKTEEELLRKYGFDGHLREQPTEESTGIDNSPVSKRKLASSRGDRLKEIDLAIADDTKQEMNEDEVHVDGRFDLTSRGPAPALRREDYPEYQQARLEAEHVVNAAAADESLRHLSKGQLEERQQTLARQLEEIIQRRDSIQREMEEYERGVTRRIGQPEDPDAPKGSTTARSWVATLFGDFTCATACG